jgi:hypothetical protein
VVETKTLVIEAAKHNASQPTKASH